MDKLSFLALIFLSLVGYSAGVVSMASRASVVKPRILDVIMIVIIWVVAICSRIYFGFTWYFAMIVWLLSSTALGIFTSNFGRLPRKRIRMNKGDSHGSFMKGMWSKWKQYSRKLGGFQSRVLLYILYFIVIMPFALVAKIFTDPLRIKSHKKESYWMSSTTDKSDLEQLRKQF